MVLSNPVCPQRVDGILLSVDEGGVVTATNPFTGKVFIVNDVARRILELCDGATTYTEIIQYISREFPGGNEEQIERDVKDFISACVDAGLVRSHDGG